MKYMFVICSLWLLMSCSDSKIEQPEGVQMRLLLATQETNRFEDYISSLNIYAFRKIAGGEYVYARTLAQLNAKDISELKDGTEQENSKYFTTSLPVGTYEIYVIGNAAGRISGEWIEDKTQPADIKILGNPGGQDSIYFLGKVKETIVTEYRTPLNITLNRIVGKLVFVLYGVPVQVDSVRITLENLTTAMSIDGTLAMQSKTISKNYPVRKTGTVSKDTIVGELLTLPSLAGGSPFRLTFYSENGQEKIKEMPLQTLLPDKYVRVTGIINDDPGALLSFQVTVNIYLFDNWFEQTLPDFTLNKRKS